MVDSKLLDAILLGSDQDVWSSIRNQLYETFSPDFTQSAMQEVISREQSINELEAVLSGACWDLWDAFEKHVPKTSDLLIDFWNRQSSGKAILIIDGLSIREIPFLLKGARDHGFAIERSMISGSELPSETTFFAKSLGFAQRSSLENNQAGSSHRLPGAVTECVDLPWQDCVSIINGEPNWVFWHTEFDDLIHKYSEPGKGLRDLFNRSETIFNSEDFWGFIERLATGRRVVITSDHGYAATGGFVNMDDREQVNYLKQAFRSSRYSKISDVDEISSWMPPIDKSVTSQHGVYRYVLGRRKWKSSGGYPTLTHGGLSLLEATVPFIEITK